MQAVTINPQFTLFTLLIRYIFFVASMISGVVYLVRFKDVPLEYRTI